MKNNSLEEIIKSIRGRFEEEQSTEPINYEEKEKEFWEKYEKHIENGYCQFWWYNKFCNKKARENYECILCNFPCCPDCYRKKWKIDILVCVLIVVKIFIQTQNFMK